MKSKRAKEKIEKWTAVVSDLWTPVYVNSWVKLLVDSSHNTIQLIRVNHTKLSRTWTTHSRSVMYKTGGLNERCCKRENRNARFWMAAGGICATYQLPVMPSFHHNLRGFTQSMQPIPEEYTDAVMWDEIQFLSSPQRHQNWWNHLSGWNLSSGTKMQTSMTENLLIHTEFTKIKNKSRYLCVK